MANPLRREFLVGSVGALGMLVPGQALAFGRRRVVCESSQPRRFRPESLSDPVDICFPDNHDNDLALRGAGRIYVWGTKRNIPPNYNNVVINSVRVVEYNGSGVWNPDGTNLEMSPSGTSWAHRFLGLPTDGKVLRVEVEFTFSDADGNPRSARVYSTRFTCVP